MTTDEVAAIRALVEKAEHAANPTGYIQDLAEYVPALLYHIDALTEENERLRTHPLMTTIDGGETWTVVYDHELPRRVFVYGPIPLEGEYGWLLRENQQLPNPYFIVTDGKRSGLWNKAEQFEFVVTKVGVNE